MACLEPRLPCDDSLAARFRQVLHSVQRRCTGSIPWRSVADEFGEAAREVLHGVQSAEGRGMNGTDDLVDGQPERWRHKTEHGDE